MSWWWYACGGAATLGIASYLATSAMVLRRSNGLSWTFLRWHMLFGAVQVAGMQWSVFLRPHMFDHVTPDIGLTAFGLAGSGTFGLLLAIAMRRRPA